MKREVKLLKSALDLFGIEGKKGDVVEVDDDTAKLMIEQGFAVDNVEMTKVKLLKSAKDDFGIEGKKGAVVEVPKEMALGMIALKFAKELDSENVKAVGKSKPVRFLKSPTGAFGLAYSPNDEAVIKDSKLRAELIKKGYATPIDG